MSKGSFYFSHDYNARNDFKIKKLISKHGYQGYGIFWAIVEDLYNNNNSLYLDYDCLAYDLRCDAKIVESIVNNFGLFEIKGEYFGSNSIQKRLEEVANKSAKARESINKRWNKSKKTENNEKGKDTNVLPQNNKNDSNVLPPNDNFIPSLYNEMKLNEIKEKEKLKKEIPAYEEFLNFAFIEKNTVDELAVRAKYQDWVENDWKDGYDKPIKNWKTKLRNTLPHLKEINLKLNKDEQRQILKNARLAIESAKNGSPTRETIENPIPTRPN